ncbi:hypothetical protein EPJ66_09685 [Brachyspira aalborgi]|uniref:Putative beta-lactamase-inhibitor-like PepSY-like domain-containing protein n=1 Tax=Brachyspira aalborgi TaxID=29522 RepID=A0A5C8ENG3_9SPIR|nr:PepSY-like domain-containing protein [Brachyspira aalborgi]TXJ38604.1 hypothetical protein EPJ81_05560 [Brachyspira aalborgi]TXJ50544.1 hypothetical protein EPJ66_09685 [Brachyspira aalborgi]
MKIKKLLIISLILGLSSSMVFADWIVPVTALPQKSRAFINSTFPGVQIWKVERDGGKFEVKLSNGVDIDFYMNGDWKDIDGEWVTIPFSVLPASVANTVKQTYPQAAIIKVEKEWGNYKIKLNNFMELYITANGQLVGQKFDD